MSGKNLFLGIALASALPLLAVSAALAEEPAAAPSGDIHYETADPVDSPPVNYRSDVEEEFDTPENRDAEMYAEEYERRQREEKIRKQEQLDRIQDFTSGARTTDGVTPDGGFGR
ncbi:MAG: hypothetical protein H5U13_10050 [Parvibaculum sp.]|nr:hypothetical protein [Parvibaculum sp.]